MGRAVIEEPHATAEQRDVVILNVGNPQCAVLVEHFDFDWQGMGARLSRHPRFPHGTNVSFVSVIDRHAIEVRFFERGAGETMSSGTGSTGAAAAARARGLVETPLRVLTPAGPLELRWDGEDILLEGPAEIVATGEFFWEGKQS
jgi:diaminopimelate epimerase